MEIEYSIDNTDWYEIYEGGFIDLTYNTGESAILYLRIKRCSLTTVYKKHYTFIEHEYDV